MKVMTAEKNDSDENKGKISNMNVAMMQPSFMPWQGLFEMIYKSDRFIFLDDFQFSVQSYHQRNRLFVNKGQVDWYSVPIQKAGSFKTPLNQTRINEAIPWRKKMLQRIRQNYSKTRFFSDIFPGVEKWMLTREESLAGQNISFIKLVCGILGLEKDVRYSSQYSSEKKSSARVVELLHWCEADSYICAKGSFDYMKEEGIFPTDEIRVLFQDFRPAKYEQIGSPDDFVPYLSILDALMNVGPGITEELLKTGTRQWQTWDDLLSVTNPKDGRN